MSVVVLSVIREVQRMQLQFLIVVAGSVKAAAFYMHIGCACCAPYSTAA